MLDYGVSERLFHVPRRLASADSSPKDPPRWTGDGVFKAFKVYREGPVVDRLAVAIADKLPEFSVSGSRGRWRNCASPKNRMGRAVRMPKPDRVDLESAVYVEKCDG
jgi:hypothetical protein